MRERWRRTDTTLSCLANSRHESKRCESKRHESKLSSSAKRRTYVFEFAMLSRSAGNATKETDSRPPDPQSAAHAAGLHYTEPRSRPGLQPPRCESRTSRVDRAGPHP